VADKTTIELIDEHFRREAVETSKDLPRVLIIDDDEDFNHLIRTAFAQKNIVIDAALTGHEGLNLAMSRDYDLVILDMKLPGLSGLEVFQRLKRSKPSASVVICTGYPDMEEVREAMKLGCFGLMEKPIDVLKLSDVFRHYHIEADV
jgi:DNA-binding NtrC family response regulator